MDTSKRHSFQLDFDIDKKFFAIIPAFNLNFHGRFTFEIEWLIFGIYIFKMREPVK